MHRHVFLDFQKNINKFMRTICYEIGGDVFSLAELNTYIIRGKLSECFYTKPPLPYVLASRRSRPYQKYALRIGDARINFLIVSMYPDSSRLD